MPDDRQRLATTRLNLGMLRLEDDPGRPPRPPSARPSTSIARLLETPSRRARVPRHPRHRPGGPGPGASGDAATWPGPDGRWSGRSSTTGPPSPRPAIATAWTRLRTDYGTLALVLGEPWATTPARPTPPSASPSSCPTPATDTSTRPPSWSAAPRWPRATRRLPPASGGPSSRGPHADRAVEWLRRAADRDLLADPAELDRDEFEPLRGRDDFERLRSVLQSRWARPFG